MVSSFSYGQPFVLEPLSPEDVLEFIDAMPDNTPGLDSTTKGDLGLVSWRGALLFCELFGAIEGGAKWPNVLTQARTAFLSEREDDMCPTGFRGLAILSKI